MFLWIDFADIEKAFISFAQALVICPFTKSLPSGLYITQIGKVNSGQLTRWCKIFDPNYILRGLVTGYFTAPFYLREGY